MKPYYEDAYVRLYHGDSESILPGLQGDHVVTDPPYDLDRNKFTQDCVGIYQVVSQGNVVAFCRPENRWDDADEYLHWVKPLSTKNFSKRCGRFVEVIAGTQAAAIQRG